MTNLNKIKIKVQNEVELFMQKYRHTFDEKLNTTFSVAILWGLILSVWFFMNADASYTQNLKTSIINAKQIELPKIEWNILIINGEKYIIKLEKLTD